MDRTALPEPPPNSRAAFPGDLFVFLTFSRLGHGYTPVLGDAYEWGILGKMLDWD